MKEMLWKLKEKEGVRVCSAFCAPHLGTERIQYYEDLVDLFYFNDGHFVRQEMLDYIRSAKPEVLAMLVKEQKYTPEIEAAAVDAITAFKAQFAVSE